MTILTTFTVDNSLSDKSNVLSHPKTKISHEYQSS